MSELENDKQLLIEQKIVLEKSVKEGCDLELRKRYDELSSEFTHTISVAGNLDKKVLSLNQKCLDKSRFEGLISGREIIKEIDEFHRAVTDIRTRLIPKLKETLDDTKSKCDKLLSFRSPEPYGVGGINCLDEADMKMKLIT